MPNSIGSSRVFWEPKRSAAMFLIAAVTLLCHLQLLFTPFVADDKQIHTQNPFMEMPANALRYFSPQRWRESHILPSPYRPIREILLVGIREVFGRGPRGYHLVSIVTHAANAALVYLAVLLMFESRGAALVAGLVFGLHPAHVEAVAWAKNIGEVVSVLFALLSAIAWVVWVRGPYGNKRWQVWVCAAGGGALGGPLALLAFLGKPSGKAGAALFGGLFLVFAAVAHVPFVVSLVCFAAGLLSKESAMSLPLILLAWALLFQRGKRRRRALVGLIPFWMMLGVYLFIQLKITPFAGSGEFSAWQVREGAWPRATLALSTYARYLRILVFPLGLRSWYDGSWLSGQSVTEQAALCLGFAALAACWVFSALRWRAGAVAVFWVMAALGPASNLLVNTGRPLAEQRLYFPSAGFAALCGALALPLAPRRAWLKWGAWLAVGLLAVYFALLENTIACWQSERRLWLRTGRTDPNLIYVMRMRQGMGHMAMEDYDEAVMAFRWGLRERPNDYRTHYQLGMAQWKQGARADAIASLKRACELAPDEPSPHAELGLAYCETGRVKEGLAFLRRAQKLMAELPAGRKGKRPGPFLLGDIAEALDKLGRHDEARLLWERSLRQSRELALKQPNSYSVHVNLCRAAAALRMKDVADAAWARAQELKPRALREGVKRERPRGL